MKKLIIATLVSLILLSGCGGTATEQNKINNDSSNNTGNTPVSASQTKDSSNEVINAEVLTKQEFDQAYTDPLKFKDRKVEFTGKVFIEPERDADGVYLQVYADPANLEKNTIIGYASPDFEVKNGDYIVVSGTIKDVFEGENLFGGTIMAPMILADNIIISDYMNVISPAVSTFEISETINQHGYEMLLERIEFAENETRVYLTITNNSDDNISFYDFNSKIIQNGSQYEATYNYDADYPEILSDILPGVTSSGIIVFDKIEPESGSFKIYLEGSSDNWDLDFDIFTFEITPE